MKSLLVIMMLLVSAVSFAEPVQTLSVTPVPGDSRDEYLHYNFGTSFVHSTKYVDFQLRAEGPQPTQIRGVALYGPGFRGETNCPPTLFPGQYCTARVYFMPRLEGHHRGDLIFHLFDKNIYVRLFANAIR